MNRPVEAGVFAQLDDMLARHRAPAATTTTTPGLRKLTSTPDSGQVAGAFADSKGRYGYRRIKAVLKTGVLRRWSAGSWREEGLVACPSDAGI